MAAEIISIGTELLRGDITDSNASFLASQLASLGIELHWVTQVGDEQSRIIEALRRAWQRSDLVITTGGLGPTVDDLTRESVAALVGEQPVVQPELERRLREFFARRGYDMPANNLKQATLIPSGRALQNRNGTAPGWWVDKDSRTIVLLPGPPHEMQSMWRDEVVPALRDKFPGSCLLTKTIKTFGLSESKVDELVAPLFKSDNPCLGIYAKPDGIHVTLTARAKEETAARDMLAPVESAVLSELGKSVWGKDDDTLEGAIFRILEERDLTVAAMEYGSGGLLAGALAAGEVAPRFRGGIVASGAEACLAAGLAPGIVARYGSVSPEAAAGMARAARVHFGASLGIAVAARTEDIKQGQTFGYACVAVSDGAEDRLSQARYPGVAAQVSRRAVAAALFELRQTLIGTGK